MVSWIFYFYSKVLFKNQKLLVFVARAVVLTLVVIYSCLIFLNGINSIDYVIDSWLISSIIFIFFELYTFKIIDDYILPVLTDTIIENQGQFFQLLWFFVFFNLALYSLYNWGANIKDSDYVLSLFEAIEGQNAKGYQDYARNIHLELQNDQNPYYVPNGFCQIQRYNPVDKDTRDYFSFNHIRDAMMINIFFGAIFSYMFSSRTQQNYYEKIHKAILKHCNASQINVYRFISFTFNMLIFASINYK